MKKGNIMKQYFKTSAIIGAGLALLVSCGEAEVGDPILQAGDLRDITSPALTSGATSPDKNVRINALKALGHIGGEQVTAQIITSLSDEDIDVRRMAAFAAGISGDPAALDVMRKRVRVETSDIVVAEIYNAMGRLIDETGLIYLAGELTITDNAVRQRGIMDGMMQVIAYKRFNAADIKGVDYAAVLKMTQGDGALSKAAGYFLARVGNLYDVIPMVDVIAAYESASNIEAKTLLLRVLRRSAGTDVQVYIEALNHESGAIQMEAVKGLLRSNSDIAKAAIRDIALNGKSALRFEALALPRDIKGEERDRYMANHDLFVEGVKAPSDMIAARALAGLAKLDVSAANEVAKTWFAGDNAYRKAKSIAILSKLAAYQSAILELSTDYSNPHVRDAARTALSLPELESGSGARDTVSSVEAYAATGRDIHFTTTRGDITVKTLMEAPYVAHNFVSLATEGGFDGMLFHRVIGNFVAQAGERTNNDFARWGTVREEWHPGLGHEIGTLGVATSGKDTGTLQFFFNINNNRHLDGRYTVFAKVTKGMDVMMALQEGDKIISASVQ